MAGEKITLFELNIDTKALIKANAEVKKSVDELKKGVKELKQEEKENNKAIEDQLKKLKDLKSAQNQDIKAIAEADSELTKLFETRTEINEAIVDQTTVLKANEKELRENNNLIQNSIAANKAQTGSIEQQRKQLAVVSVEWAKLSKEERTNTDRGKALTKQKKDLTDALKKEEKATSDARRDVGNYSDSIRNALGVTGSFVPVVGSAGNAVGGLGKAFSLALGPIGLVVAAIALVVGSMKEFFTSSEEGQDAWDEFSATVDVTTGNISDAFSALGKKFSEPKKSLQELSDFFGNTFGKFWEGQLKILTAETAKFFNEINLSFQIFKDNFKDNSKAIVEAQEAINKNNKEIRAGLDQVKEGAQATGQAFTDATDALNKFNEEQLREIEIAKELARRQGSVNRQIRSTLINNAKLEKEIAESRILIAQKDKFSSQERLELLEETIAKEKQILDANISIAKQKAFIKIEQNKLSNSTREDLDEEARLRADIFKVEKTSLQQRRRLEIELSALRKQINQENRQEAIKAAKDNANLSAEEAAQAVQDLKDQIAIEQSLKAQAKEVEQDARQREITDRANELAIAEGNIVAELDIERRGLEAKKAQELEFAQAIGADKELVNEKFARAERALDEATFIAKLSLAAEFTGNIAAIAGKQTAIGKAAAVAETSINTFKAAQASYSSLAGIPIVGPALGAVAAAAAVVTGIRNVKEILSVESGLPGDTGGGSAPSASGAVPNVTAPQVQAPQVDQGIVSRETITEQAEQAQPIIATPVDDVTLKQQQSESNSTTSVI